MKKILSEKHILDKALLEWNTPPHTLIPRLKDVHVMSWWVLQQKKTYIYTILNTEVKQTTTRGKSVLDLQEWKGIPGENMENTKF